MGLFDFLSRPKREEKKEEKKEGIISENGSIDIDLENDMALMVYGISTDSTFAHRNKSQSDLVKARTIVYQKGDKVPVTAAKYVCFEIPKGRKDLMVELLRKSAFFQLPKEQYCYLGRIYEKDDYRMQPPTATVNHQIETINNKLQEQLKVEKMQARLEQERREQERRQNVAVRAETNEKREQAQAELYQREKNARLQRPELTGGVTSYGESYDGINLQNGEILRIREVRKKCKDMSGTYVYTACVNSTPHKDDIDNIDYERNNIGVPVVFTLPFRLNDIVNQKYSEEYKEQLKQGILQVLSNGYEQNIDRDGCWDRTQLHDIGGINKSGQAILNDYKNISPELNNKIREFQAEYRKRNMQREDSDWENR